MFTSFSLKNSRAVSDAENLEFQELLEVYSRTSEGQWLSEIPYHQFKIKWCSAMTMKSGIMGAFVPWMGKTIFLMPSSSPVLANMSDPWPELIVSTLVHELRHAWQFQKYKLLYIFCCLPVLREFTLEMDAKRIWEPATKFFEKLSADRAAAKMQKLH